MCYRVTYFNFILNIQRSVFIFIVKRIIVIIIKIMHVKLKKINLY